MDESSDLSTFRRRRIQDHVLTRGELNQRLALDFKSTYLGFYEKEFRIAAADENGGAGCCEAETNIGTDAGEELLARAGPDFIASLA